MAKEVITKKQIYEWCRTLYCSQLDRHSLISIDYNRSKTIIQYAESLQKLLISLGVCISRENPFLCQTCASTEYTLIDQIQLPSNTYQGVFHRCDRCGWTEEQEEFYTT